MRDDLQGMRDKVTDLEIKLDRVRFIWGVDGGVWNVDGGALVMIHVSDIIPHNTGDQRPKILFRNGQE